MNNKKSERPSIAQKPNTSNSPRGRSSSPRSTAVAARDKKAKNVLVPTSQRTQRAKTGPSEMKTEYLTTEFDLNHLLVGCEELPVTQPAPIEVFADPETFVKSDSNKITSSNEQADDCKLFSRLVVSHLKKLSGPYRRKLYHQITEAVDEVFNEFENSESKS